MSNVRALRMLSLARRVIAEPLLSCGTGAFIAPLVGAVSRQARLSRSSSASSCSSLISSSPSSASSPISSLSLRSLFHGLHRRQLLALRREHRMVPVRLTRALRAGVLRRAVSALSRLAASVRKLRVEPQASCWSGYRSSRAFGRLVPVPSQRPNPSIEGTSNIRLRLLSAAPHVKR
jgi:hypothetical protein